VREGNVVEDRGRGNGREWIHGKVKMNKESGVVTGLGGAVKSARLWNWVSVMQ